MSSNFLETYFGWCVIISVVCLLFILIASSLENKVIYNVKCDSGYVAGNADKIYTDTGTLIIRYYDTSQKVYYTPLKGEECRITKEELK